MNVECECSEDLGPCELHATVLVIREGASLHTADELAALFILDAGSVGAVVSPADHELAVSVDGWIDDESGESQDELQDIVQRVESTLPDGVWAVWNDGYTIVRVSDDCPLLNV